jgi:hypothetical protein
MLEVFQPKLPESSTIEVILPIIKNLGLNIVEARKEVLVSEPEV